MNSANGIYSSGGGQGREDREDHSSPKNPIDQIADWLSSSFSRLNKEATEKDSSYITSKIIVRLEHHKLNDKPDDVETYDYLPGNSVEDMAEEISRRAAQDAEVIGGGSYFVKIDGINSRWAISFEGPNTRSSANMVRHGVMGSGFGGGGRETNGYGGGGGNFQQRPGGGGGYDQNPAGMIVQALVQDKSIQLAHNEKLLELAISAQTDTQRLTRSIIAEQHETIRTYEKARMNGITVMEDLYSKKQERDIEMAKLVKMEERKDRAWNMVEPMAFSIAARFFGGKGVPSELSPIFNMLTSAFSKMDMPRLQKLLGSGLLQEQEATALVELFKVLTQIQEEAAAKNAANGTNGAAATNGAAK